MSETLTTTVEVINQLGLHARTSAQIASTAGRYGSTITLEYDGQSADAASIMSLMMLAASKGAQIVITTEGPDAADAHQAIVDLFRAGFGES